MHRTTTRQMALSTALLFLISCVQAGVEQPKTLTAGPNPDCFAQDSPEPVMTLPAARIVFPGNVYILALGANSGRLRWANWDAAHFAWVMQSLLTVPASQLGYAKIPQLRLVRNATPQDFMAGMEWLRTTVQSGDLVLLFFSGHGTFLPDDEDNKDEPDGWDEALVLCRPPGVTSSDPQTYTIRDDTLAAAVQALPTEQILVVLDTCFSGALGRGSGDVEPKFFWPWKWEEKTPPKRIEDIEPLPKGVLLAAARGNQRAWEMKGEGGLFTTEFLRALTSIPQDNVSTVFAYTVPRVRKRSQTFFEFQEPVSGGNLALTQALRLQQEKGRSTRPQGTRNRRF